MKICLKPTDFISEYLTIESVHEAEERETKRLQNADSQKRETCREVPFLITAKFVMKDAYPIRVRMKTKYFIWPWREGANILDIITQKYFTSMTTLLSVFLLWLLLY